MICVPNNVSRAAKLGNICFRDNVSRRMFPSLARPLRNYVFNGVAVVGLEGLHWWAMAATRRLSLKKWICAFSNCIAIITARPFCRILANFPEASKFKESVRKLSCCVWRQRNAPRSVLHVHSCCFSYSNLSPSFLTFSLPSSSSLLRLPNIMELKGATSRRFCCFGSILR